MKRYFKTPPSLPVIFFAGTVIATLAISIWSAYRVSSVSVRLSSRPAGIMGTECELVVVVPEPQASLALARAENALRNVESLMSVHIEASELSKLNAAPAGEQVRLSPELLNILRTAGKFHEQTDGAFDVTCYPLVRLWKECKAEGRQPSEAEIAEAQRLVGSSRRLQIGPDSVTKLIAGVSVDLGGIAKGYAIDRAIEAMIEAGAGGGLVNVGGDLRCFGAGEDGKPWAVKIRHPFDKSRICATLSLTDAAVATSGDYHRYFEIDGKRFSHIVDPRTGQALPVGHAPSVTVVSLPVGDVPPSAAAADAWATALSVLGRGGIDLINAHLGLEAMIITGTPDEYTIHASEAFKTLLQKGTQIELFTPDYLALLFMVRKADVSALFVMARANLVLVSGRMRM